MSNKIAIDVALLPSEVVMDKAIEMNRQSVDDSIPLNKKDYLPHISLCMGVIEENKLFKVSKLLEPIARKHLPLALTIEKVNGEKKVFEIKKSEELQKLHETVMNNMKPYLTYDATTEMCFTPPIPSERVINYINTFDSEHGFKNFYPHITIGKNKLKEYDLVIDFFANTLAIGHIGAHGAFRKILHLVKLAGD